MPDALRSSGLQYLLQHVESSCVCRPDKAFTPHPALGAQCLMRYAYQALYYPSSAEKIGQFSLPAVRMPYRALGSNLLRRFMQRTAFLPK
ncbi:hypothetical protein AM365_17940 [Escherichia coli]|nr:hypothetical protein BE957_07375 [Escherichia coli]EFK49615.1 hypothetical protein HMPREF9345_03861 [Escherichia coli MS 107-1]EGU94980.1 hypothetical protein HMPREF9349_05130 [Escherichia coli MS 79-10]ARA18655.1 hypothetical protein AM365_17940 [Escherichia coli]ARV29050.1 hypothetical protein BS635_03995 [Escherichia coli]